MRRFVKVVGLGFAIGVAIGVGCAASQDTEPSGSGGGTGGTGTGNGTGTGGTGAIDVNQPDTVDPDAACAKFSAEAKQAPAAMLIVLDRTASMSTNNKWATAQLAVVSAIDKDVFDTMALGLVSFPQNVVAPPQCLCDDICAQLGVPGCSIAECQQYLQLSGYPTGVACGITALPQVAIAPAGLDKSNAQTGVRHAIYQYLSTTLPETADPFDSSPIYEALSAGYLALQAYPIDKRVLVLITDGGFSCTSLSSPPRPGYNDGACNDWEYPDTVNTLISQKRTDATAPVNTFVVGVPGSDSTGGMQGSYATAPYHMRLALSTYAVSGSPDTVDPTCDKAATFTQGGADPAKSCHIDLSSGQFDANVLSSAIETIRGKALGCVYDMPQPQNGDTIDPAQVNVSVSLEAMTPYGVPRRSDGADTCLDGVGCWDYKDATNAQVELIGKACTDVSSAKQAKVDIVVGCETVLK